MYMIRVIMLLACGWAVHGKKANGSQLQVISFKDTSSSFENKSTEEKKQDSSQIRAITEGLDARRDPPIRPSAPIGRVIDDYADGPLRQYARDGEVEKANEWLKNPDNDAKLIFKHPDGFPKDYPLRIAVEKGDIKMVTLFIEWCFKSDSGLHDLQTELNGTGEDSLLIMALKNKHGEVLKLLVKTQGEVDDRNDIPGDLLHQALWDRNEEVACALIDAGANVNYSSTGGEFVIHVAVEVRLPKTVKKLLEKGANVNQRKLSFHRRTNTDPSPLHVALMRHLNIYRGENAAARNAKRIDILKSLLEREDIDTQMLYEIREQHEDHGEYYWSSREMSPLQMFEENMVKKGIVPEKDIEFIRKALSKK